MGKKQRKRDAIKKTSKKNEELSQVRDPIAEMTGIEYEMQNFIFNHDVQYSSDKDQNKKNIYYEKDFKNEEILNEDVIYHYNDGSIYEGNMKNGQPNGKGIMKSKTSIYEGDFKDGKFHGFGKEKYIDGDTYEGQFQNEYRSGKGTFNFKVIGKVYEGEHKDGGFNGQGMLTYRDGSKYVGYFQNDMLQHGKWFGINKKLIYEGEFSASFFGDPFPHGKGIMHGNKNISNIFIKSDNFNSGEINGFGEEYIIQNGEEKISFSGHFEKSKYNGKGTKVYDNGDIYEGNFKGGCRHGDGTYRYETGDFFEGKYENNKRSGDGIIIRANGEKWKGNWKNGKKISFEKIENDKEQRQISENQIHEGKKEQEIYIKKYEYEDIIFHSDVRGQLYKLILPSEFQKEELKKNIDQLQSRSAWNFLKHHKSLNFTVFDHEINEGDKSRNEILDLAGNFSAKINDIENDYQSYNGNDEKKDDDNNYHLEKDYPTTSTNNSLSPSVSSIRSILKGEEKIEEKKEDNNDSEIIQVQFTQDALKWVKRADSKYKEMFFKRIKQLANGERSQKLQKRLVGTKSKIHLFEAYFDQNRSAQRILWTEFQDKDRNIGILVWRISKHDDVGRHMRLIDNTYNRLSKQPEIVQRSLYLDIDLEGEEDIYCNKNNSEGAFVLDDDTILLDPSRNTPLRLHQISKKDLTNLINFDDWIPPLRLTSSEIEIVKPLSSEERTVMVLGRSGTGKTICIANRMVYDRKIWHYNSEYDKKQLFIARNQRLCENVRYLVFHNEIQQQQDQQQQQQQQQENSTNKVDNNNNNNHRTNTNMQFFTLKHLLRICINTIKDNDFECANQLSTIERHRRINYIEFRDQIFPEYIKKEIGNVAIDPLVIWTQIRSNIKGSIETIAPEKVGPLSKDEYLNFNIFSINRVRLDKETREIVYMAYEKYRIFCVENDRYDDIDLVRKIVTMLLTEIRENKQIDHKEKILEKYDKIYVDEIQDFSQIEIALFSLLSGVNKLFLAGDPAQGVEEGIDFRFKNIRSVFHHLPYDKVSIDKPKKLFVNFRSHSGILNIAALVLEKLFKAFPGSADEIPQDTGIFYGPKPGFFMGKSSDNDYSNLYNFLENNERVVILVHNNKEKDRIRGIINQNDSIKKNAILGIREAKGLEFPEVAIVDFFCGLDTQLQKHLKKLLNTSNELIYDNDYPPEIEYILKYLYTAITRCCNRLFFIETRKTEIGNRFLLWLDKFKYIENFNIDAESFKSLMTSDEWKIRGIEFAINADEAESPKDTIKWLEHAYSCFEDTAITNHHNDPSSFDKELKKKLQRHLSSAHFRLELNNDLTISPDLNTAKEPKKLQEKLTNASEILINLLKEGLMIEFEKVCFELDAWLKKQEMNEIREKFEENISGVVINILDNSFFTKM